MMAAITYNTELRKKMAKQTWKAREYALSASGSYGECYRWKGQDDIITVAWTGTICTNPPMVIFQ